MICFFIRGPYLITIAPACDSKLVDVLFPHLTSIEPETSTTSTTRQSSERLARVLKTRRSGTRCGESVVAEADGAQAAGDRPGRGRATPGAGSCGR
jgi:hypothetical protein